ncbi:MAG: phosphocholine cytidylyltransferase family protein [Balneolaceae bacterium]|nr:MAG: phosphocholine cytidylyltransferase family protein [Balneolaceae bacterium]
MNYSQKQHGINTPDERVETAVLLAAGLGRRIQPISQWKPKCLIEAGGFTLLECTIRALEFAGIKKLIIVTGHLAEQIDSFIKSMDHNLTIHTIHNSKFASTNNVYSLWLAGKELNEPFLLLESDLIYDTQALKEFVIPDRIALDLYKPELHSGTTANLSKNGFIQELLSGTVSEEKKGDYKTVNICSLSVHSWELLRKKIEKCIKKNDVNLFYEQAIGELISEKSVSLKMVDFSAVWWDEIDSISDLKRVTENIESRLLRTGT